MSKGKHHTYGRILYTIACLLLTGIEPVLCAVWAFPEITDSIIPIDDIPAIRLDSISLDTTNMIVMQQSKRSIHKIQSAEFKPNPKKAWKIATVFPGAGQFYNRQYWKLPIVYGGFAGFLYAITWNNKNYQDYQRAYFDIIHDAKADPNAEHPDTWGSWQDFFPAGDPAAVLRDNYRHTQLKNGKDFYRKYRDLSIILSIAFYAICVADAYVDAQMAEFNMSPDLSFRVTPELFPSSLCNTRGYGINLCLTF